MIVVYIFMLIIGLALACGTVPVFTILINKSKFDNWPIGIPGVFGGTIVLVGIVLATIAVNLIGG